MAHHAVVVNDDFNLDGQADLAPFDASAYDSAMRVNGAEPRMHDVDLDGCADLVMAWTTAPLRTESPLVYRNNGSDRFEAISPEPFAGADRRPAARPKRWESRVPPAPAHRVASGGAAPATLARLAVPNHHDAPLARHVRAIAGTRILDDL